MPENRVEVRLGWTRNMGDFNSMRVDIGVEGDKQANETTDQCFERLYKFVEDRLLEKVEETEKEIKSLSAG